MSAYRWKSTSGDDKISVKGDVLIVEIMGSKIEPFGIQKLFVDGVLGVWLISTNCVRSVRYSMNDLIASLPIAKYTLSRVNNRYHGRQYRKRHWDPKGRAKHWGFCQGDGSCYCQQEYGWSL